MKFQRAYYLEDLPAGTRGTITVTPPGGTAVGDEAGVLARIREVYVFLAEEQDASKGVAALADLLRKVADELDAQAAEFS